MAYTRYMMSMHDDQAGEGVALAFPTVSTCAAVIAVLGDRLVGLHKTSGISRNYGKLIQRGLSLLNFRYVRALYIAGWNLDQPSKHDPRAIRQALGCTHAPIYISNLSSTRDSWERTTYSPHPFATAANDVCIFAYHQGSRAPRIGLKRSSKVTVKRSVGGTQQINQLAQQLGMGFALIYGVEEEITTTSDHLHELQFHRLE